MIRAYALSVAWEQVAHWRSVGFTAREASAVLGLRDGHDWAPVARQLAATWLDLKQQQFVEFARAA